MNQSSSPSTPQHREKLIDLESDETTATSKDLTNAQRGSQATEEVGGAQPGSEESPMKSAVHVNPIGENWEVESDAGTLGQAETKQEAVELARTLAKRTARQRSSCTGATARSNKR